MLWQWAAWKIANKRDQHDTSSWCQWWRIAAGAEEDVTLWSSPPSWWSRWWRGWRWACPQAPWWRWRAATVVVTRRSSRQAAARNKEHLDLGLISTGQTTRDQLRGVNCLRVLWKIFFLGTNDWILFSTKLISWFYIKHVWKSQLSDIILSTPPLFLDNDIACVLFNIQTNCRLGTPELWARPGYEPGPL